MSRPLFKQLIGDAERYFCINRHNAETAPEMIVRQHWRLFPVCPPVPDIDVSVAAQTRVTDGYWLVDCPWCDGAPQFASRKDHRFFCVECGNVEAGGKWIPVTWPTNWAEIEEVLLQRPDPRTRTWLPTETVEDLRWENREHGGELLAVG